MNVPPHLNGDGYLRRLREYRELALSESCCWGQNREIGKLCVETALAAWQAESGDEAYLAYRGIRYARLTIPRLATELQIVAEVGDDGAAVTTYKMDLDGNGQIRVGRYMLTGDNAHDRFINTLGAIMFTREEKRYGLNLPTDRDRALIMAEMQRGATGLFPIEYDSWAD